jgi:MtN3 and saliva related transmembrane protein
MTNTLGIVAAIFTSSTFLSQIIKSWRSKSTKDISSWMMFQMSLGIALWLIYGFLKGDIVILTAQAIAAIFTTILLILKIKYR